MRDSKQKKRKRTNGDIGNGAPDETTTSMNRNGGSATGNKANSIARTTPAAALTTTTTYPASAGSTIIKNISNHGLKQRYQPQEVLGRTVQSRIVPLNSTKQYITIQDGPMYHELLQNTYLGFSYVPASQVNTMLATEPSTFNQEKHPIDCRGGSENFHNQYQNVLQSLYDYYQYDIIMPGGKHSSRTFVRRTLVGEPGMTYKYLGLRLFTHAWRNTRLCDDVASASKKETKSVSSLFHNVYLLNQAMIQMTEHQTRIYQERTGKVVPKHMYDYNLTLINYMEPCDDVKSHSNSNHSLSRGQHQQLRDEEFYNMGKASVSWHADSSLQDNSCIGVYHTLLQNTAGDIPSKTKSTTTQGYHKSDVKNSSNEDNDWKIALRPNPTTATTTNPGKKARFSDGTKNNKSTNSNIHTMTLGASKVASPPIVVPTKSGDVYFLLDEFNHKFQHMVLAGSNHQYRISSTHRVAVTATDTYQYISKACSSALLSSKAEMKKTPSHIHRWDTSILLQTQTVLNEVEFEWIAQYWIQGKRHDEQHLWWQKPIRALEDAWNALEKITYKIYNNIISLCAAAMSDKQDSIVPSRELVQGLLLAFQGRQEMRLKWDHRRADKIYKRRISLPYQPIERPLFSVSDNTTPTNPNHKTDPKKQLKQLPKDLTHAIQTLSDLLQTYPQKKNSTTQRQN